MAENMWEKRPGDRAEKRASSGVVIRGDVSGHEPLFIDGTVEGSINFL